MALESCVTALEDDVRVFGIREKVLEVQQPVLLHLLLCSSPSQAGQLARDGYCGHQVQQGGAPCCEKPSIFVVFSSSIKLDSMRLELTPHTACITGTKVVLGRISKLSRQCTMRYGLEKWK